MCEIAWLLLYELHEKYEKRYVNSYVQQYGDAVAPSASGDAKKHQVCERV